MGGRTEADFDVEEFKDDESDLLVVVILGDQQVDALLDQSAQLHQLLALLEVGENHTHQSQLQHILHEDV